MSSTTLLYIIFKSYCGIIKKNPIKNLFPYFPIHFTMGTDVEVTFSLLRSITTQKYFDVVMYLSMSSIFGFLEQLSISYASWFKVFENVLFNTFHYGN